MIFKTKYLLIVLLLSGCTLDGPLQGELQEENPIEDSKSHKQKVSDYKNYNDDILYNNLSDEENITILLNYFVKKEFDDAIPLLPPKKELLRGDEERFEDYKTRVLEANKTRLKLANEYNSKLKQQKEDIVKIVQQSLNKAIGVVYGRPKFVDFNYDYGEKVLKVRTISNNLKFQEETEFKLEETEINEIRDDFAFMAPRIIFDYSDHELDIRGVMFIYKNKKYFGRFKERKFTKMHIPLVVDFKQYKNIY